MKKCVIHSWNVNGMRAVLKKGFEEYLLKYSPDIVCLQEVKARKEQVELVPKNKKLVDVSNKDDFVFESYPHIFWNAASRSGYSGVAIFSKIKPLNVKKGIEHSLDKEGRVLTLEFDMFFVVCVYTPNSKRDLSRIPIRQTWDLQLLKYCKDLESEKPVVICGDLNVAHMPLDLKNDKANEGKKGYTKEEREGFSNFIKEKFIDTFRFLHPRQEKYSWWSYMFNARAKNVGWRIDYILISDNLKSGLVKAEIHSEVLGSDHCPVSCELEFEEN